MRYSPYRLMFTAVFFFACFAQVARADKVTDLVKEGNEAFLKKEYSTALDQYQIAEGERPDLPELNYNIASVLYEQGKYEESIERFKKSLGSEDPALQAAAHYNLGNTFFRSGDYMKAIESYQNALGMNPDDMDAKYNLELARKMLKENSKPEQSKDKKNQQQKEQEKKKQDENKEDQDKDKKDKQDKDQDQQDQKNKQEQDKKDQEQKNQQQKKDQKKMSKEDAERILNALRDDEQKQQAKVRRVRSSGDYTGEDW